jgi:hypothetical protein
MQELRHSPGEKTGGLDSPERFPHRLHWSYCFCCIAFLMSGLTGCATSAYRYGRAENYHSSPQLAAIRGDQIERGKPRPVLDGIGWVVGIPSKIILWDHRVDNHSVSPETEVALSKYLDDNELQDVKVRVNQYAPGDEWRRLVANKSVGAGWRYTLGTLAWAGYTVFPGRVFGGDNYNPFTNTISVYSDAPALVLHEGGHAKDFSGRRLPGTYAAIYVMVPFAPLYHEAVATSDALRYLRTEGTAEDEQEAYRLLYPAYGTYVGGAFGGTIVTVVSGHIWGRVKGSYVPKEREADQDSVAAVRERHEQEMASRRNPRREGKLAANPAPALAKRTTTSTKRRPEREAVTEVNGGDEESTPVIQPAGHSTIQKD